MIPRNASHAAVFMIALALTAIGAGDASGGFEKTETYVVEGYRQAPSISALYWRSYSSSSVTSTWIGFAGLTARWGSLHLGEGSTDDGVYCFLPLRLHVPMQTKRFHTSQLFFEARLLTSEGSGASDRPVPRYFNVGFSRSYLMGQLEEEEELFPFLLSLEVSVAYRYQLRNLITPDGQRQSPSGEYVLGFRLGLMDASIQQVRTERTRTLPSPEMHVSASRSEPESPMLAGDSFDLHVEMRNRGRGLVEDGRLSVRVIPASLAGFVDCGLTPISTGNMAGGEVGRRSFRCSVKGDAPRSDDARVRVDWREKDGFFATTSVTVPILPTGSVIRGGPSLTVSAAFEDDNGNGVLETMESARILIDIENRGNGPAWDICLRCELGGGSAERFVSLGSLTGGNCVRRLDPGQKTQFAVPIRGEFELRDGAVRVVYSVEERNGFGTDQQMVLEIPTRMK